MIKSNIQLRVITAMVNTEAVIEADILTDVGYSIESQVYILRVQTYYIDANQRMPLEQLTFNIAQDAVEGKTPTTVLERLQLALIDHLNQIGLYGSQNNNWIQV